MTALSNKNCLVRVFLLPTNISLPVILFVNNVDMLCGNLPVEDLFWFWSVENVEEVQNIIFINIAK